MRGFKPQCSPSPPPPDPRTPHHEAGPWTGLQILGVRFAGLAIQVRRLDRLLHTNAIPGRRCAPPGGGGGGQLDLVMPSGGASA